MKKDRFQDFVFRALGNKWFQFFVFSLTCFVVIYILSIIIIDIAT